MLKGIFGRHFSFLVFCGAQVLMDIETGILLMARAAQVHAFSTTFLGALLIGLVAGAIGKPITNLVLKLVAPSSRQVTWMASFSSAFAGTLSHVVLDSIMHSDAQPWEPFANGNQFLGFIGVEALHILCIVLCIVGVFSLGYRAHALKKA